jgi:hypothetical protein
MTDRETPVMTDEIDPQVDDAQASAAVETPDLPVVVVPDRADAPVSEITERFLRSIVAKVPLDRIEELHLFSPLRQSGVETGIAVVAARVPVVLVELPVEAPAVTELALDPTSETIADDETAPVEAVADEVTELLADEAADDEDVHAEHVVSAPTPIERHTVYTARYRLVQKGPERGKWEADVVAEADAPLITVETVVRGVQRRAGEESEILRYSARQIAKALHQPWPLVSTDVVSAAESTAA